MTKMYNLAGSVLLITLMSAAAVFAQGPGAAAGPHQTSSPAPQPVAPAPSTLKAKYEGGVFGYNKKMDGTLNFDDTNNRLVFRNKEQAVVLFIPYAAVVSEYGDKQARRPAAATVMSSMPVPYGLNLPAYFFKKKYQYLTLEFNDPDTKVSGITSFKLANKEILASAVASIASRAGLVQRGQVYVKAASGSTPAQSTSPE